MAVWKKTPEGYEPTEETSRKLARIVKWAADKYGFDLGRLTVHVIGSITSNSYSDGSDVDLHFC